MDAYHYAIKSQNLFNNVQDFRNDKENRDFVIIQKIMTRRELKNEIECLKILKDELNSIRKNIFE